MTDRYPVWRKCTKHSLSPLRLACVQKSITKRGNVKKIAEKAVAGEPNAAVGPKTRLKSEMVNRETLAQGEQITPDKDPSLYPVHWFD